MLKYVIKRILLLIMTLIIITAISFILIRLMPYPKPTEGDNAANIIAYLDSIGFYEPMPYQMWLYVKRLFETGSFGMSYHLWPAHSVEALLLKKIPATIVVNLYSVILAIPLGLFLGILAALKKNKLTDQTISIAVIAFISVPSFIYAFLFQYFFAYKWPILPLRMYMGEDFFSLRMFPSIILPIISLALGSIAGIARYTRAELIEVLTGEYMFLARTKGLSRGQATVRHALRNSMVPIFPMLLGEFIGIIGGSLIIEKIFSVPGVGELYVDAINIKDFDVFLFLCIFYVSIGLLSGLVVDLSYGFVDPRIRMGGKK